MKYPIYSPIKKISTDEKKVFLTFDDGPCPILTPKILTLLKMNNAYATFFIVSDKAVKHPDIVNRILTEGHAIGDHSLDHNYHRYFSSHKQTIKWITASQNTLEQLCSSKPVAFRSPAGIWTPKLAKALKELQIPWVHWNIRFFDTIRAFTKNQVNRKIVKIVPGSIVLLHDQQSDKRSATFLESLTYLIEKLHLNGFSLERLHL